MRSVRKPILILLALFLVSGCLAEAEPGDTPLCYDDFKKLSIEEQIAGENNIAQGAESAGHPVEPRYGYYGKTAPWIVSGLELVGGSNQMNTVFSWGTLNSSGLITRAGTEEIN